MSVTQSHRTDGAARAVPEDLAAFVDQRPGFLQALSNRLLIEQAKGAISAQAGVPLGVAYEMLSDLAASSGRNIHVLAAGAIANRGRLDRYAGGG